MIANLLERDFRRVGRNPMVYLIMLALPFVITAIIGISFGSAAGGKGLPKIKLAVVDEDGSMISNLLLGAMKQGPTLDYLEPLFLDRNQALVQLNGDQISAVLIIPAGFGVAFVDGVAAPPIELVKNPAQRFMPAIIEEMTSVLVEGLNALSRHLGGDLAQASALFEGKGAPSPENFGLVAAAIAGKFKGAERYLFPPILTFSAETKSSAKPQSGFNLFAFILPAISALFLFFMADMAVRDLYKEMRIRTLDRYRTMRPKLGAFLAAKLIFATLIVVAGGLILFCGAGLIFAVKWRQPGMLILLLIGFAMFAAGFQSLLAALARTERRADMINPTAIMLISLLGGSMLPASQLPALVRDHISPWMPTYWFSQAVAQIQFQAGTADPLLALAGLAGLGMVFAALAAVILNRSLSHGVRP